MEVRFQNLGPEHWKGDVLLAFACEGEELLQEHPELDKAAPWLAVAPALRDFRPKEGALALLHGHPELAIPRVLAIGLGKREAVTPERIRKAVAAAVQRCRALGVASILLPEPQLGRLPGGRERLVEECVCAAQLALYRFDALKKAPKDENPATEWLALGFDGESVPDGGHAAARRGESAAWAVMLARDLANMPGNLLSPALLAERAATVAEESGLTCEILDEDTLAHGAQAV
ncbi:MAG: aminopeptidase, partial [Desulfovibrio sp.]|nr:aminopeptidase [Desulfovibrio sp.]